MAAGAPGGGMAVEAYEEMKAGLPAWMHLTGQSKSGEPAPAGIMAGAGPVVELPQGGPGWRRHGRTEGAPGGAADGVSAGSGGRSGVCATAGRLGAEKPGAARSWGWQYGFGGLNIIEEQATGRMIRWHVHENTVGRLLGEAARRCGMVRHVTCQALRHSFATLALENGTDKCRCGASALRPIWNNG